ncbi:transglycosylase SLT domain-containing protein [Candidatus Gottesmanbacteria bacterium]|nr:transglycosylase SLT domain-containing protein [Candidatus Gottesmanbacteria bacterium]
MRQYIFFILLVLFLSPLGGLVHSAYASAEAIEEDAIQKLMIDPRSEVPEYKLLPKPTPAPQENSLQTEDDRAWTTSLYRKTIGEVANKYHLDAQLLYATIMTESEGNEFAFRYEPQIKDASFCIGQILLSTARSLGFNGEPKELYNPEICIDLMGRYYRFMLDTHGELTFVQLAQAYNTGSPFKWAVPGHIERFTIWYEEKGS